MKRRNSTLIGIAIWVSIAISGYFAMSAIWDLSTKQPITHFIVLGFLFCLWIAWFCAGGLLGIAAIGGLFSEEKA